VQEGYDAFMQNSQDELREFITNMGHGWYRLIIEFRKVGEKTRLEHLDAGSLDHLFEELRDTELDERLGRTLAYLPDSKLDQLISYMDPAIKAQYGWAN